MDFSFRGKGKGTANVILRTNVAIFKQSDVVQVADTWGLCFTRWNDKVSVRRCHPSSPFFVIQVANTGIQETYQVNVQ